MPGESEGYIKGVSHVTKEAAAVPTCGREEEKEGVKVSHGNTLKIGYRVAEVPMGERGMEESNLQKTRRQPAKRDWGEESKERGKQNIKTEIIGPEKTRNM